MISLLKTREIRDRINAKPEDVQQIINSSEYGICITDENGVFRHVNDNYTEIYGYAREDLLGNKFTMIVPEEAREYLMQLHDKFIQQGAEISRMWTVQGKDGTPMKIFADARYTDKLNNKPHKITFVEKA
jgi:two-component system CheB/CheR fusion protein